MRPDSAFTTPEQRFFFPQGLEAECHPSFDIENQPQAEMLQGETGYVVIENLEGKEVAAQTGLSANLRPGEQVKRVITFGSGDDEATFPGKPWLHADNSDEIDDKKWLDNPVDTYDPQEGDLLVLKVNDNSLSKDAAIRRRMDENRVLLWPADKKLPYSNGEQEGDDPPGRLSYGLQGVITPELRFVGWRDGYNRSARYLIDLAVASANMQNTLERSVLDDSIPGQSSLVGMVGLNKAVEAYLRYFKTQKGTKTNYVPNKDPGNRYGEFPPMTADQKSRYELVFQALHASSRIRKP